MHGLLPGDGGTGQMQGLAAMSPAQMAGDPPIITFACLGMIVTLPWWQQATSAEALTIGGTPLTISHR